MGRSMVANAICHLWELPAGGIWAPGWQYTSDAGSSMALLSWPCLRNAARPGRWAVPRDSIEATGTNSTLSSYRQNWQWCVHIVFLSQYKEGTASMPLICSWHCCMSIAESIPWDSCMFFLLLVEVELDWICLAITCEQCLTVWQFGLTRSACSKSKSTLHDSIYW